MSTVLSEEAVRKDADRFFVFLGDKLPDALGCGFYPWEDSALVLFQQFSFCFLFIIIAF